MASDLAARIRQSLAAHGDPGKAPGMQRYMKSEMPYRGVQTPLLRRLCRNALRDHPVSDREAWLDAVLDLWRNARFREERYAALELAGARGCEAFRTLEVLALFEEFVVTGAWWDFVDNVASKRLRELLEKYPAEMSAQMRAWSRDSDRWKRRAAIICQLNRKSETDLALLFDCIGPNLGDPDFFIRKGIGWALRSLAWSDLAAVETYVAANADRISPLSRREALKNAAKIRARGS